jgi:nucleolar pre-ribosomal-associated protein 1
MLLKLVVTSKEEELYSGIKTLLSDMLRDYEMLQMDTHPDALDALLASLAPSCGSSTPPQEAVDFIDECCGRFIKSPIKYSDDLEAIRSSVISQDAKHGPFSLLLMTFVEQWPFKGGKSAKGQSAEALAQWLSKLLYLLKLIGEDESLLEAVRQSLVSSADQAYQQVLKDSFLWKMGKEKAKEALKSATGADFSSSERSSASPLPMEQTKEESKAVAVVDLELPPAEDHKHAGLNRWRKKDIEESIDDGDVGELLLCLCSKYTEIRLQALNNIRQLMAKIEVCSSWLFLRVLLTGL